MTIFLSFIKRKKQDLKRETFVIFFDSILDTCKENLVPKDLFYNLCNVFC